MDQQALYLEGYAMMLRNISCYFHVLIPLGSSLASRLNELISPETDGLVFFLGGGWFCCCCYCCCLFFPLFQEINKLFSTKGLGVTILGFCGSRMISGTDSFFVSIVVCSFTCFYNLRNIRKPFSTHKPWKADPLNHTFFSVTSPMCKVGEAGTMPQHEQVPATKPDTLT